MTSYSIILTLRTVLNIITYVIIPLSVVVVTGWLVAVIADLRSFKLETRLDRLSM